MQPCALQIPSLPPVATGVPRRCYRFVAAPSSQRRPGVSMLSWEAPSNGAAITRRPALAPHVGHPDRRTHPRRPRQPALTPEWRTLTVASSPTFGTAHGPAESKGGAKNEVDDASDCRDRCRAGNQFLRLRRAEVSAYGPGVAPVATPGNLVVGAAAQRLPGGFRRYCRA